MTQISGSNQAWNVGKVGLACASCGSAMEPGKACWAALVEVRRSDEATQRVSDAGAAGADQAASVVVKEPAGEKAKDGAAAVVGLPYQRVDFCEGCWDGGKRPEGEMISFWKTVVPTPTAKKKLLVDDSVLMDIFMRLEDGGIEQGMEGGGGDVKKVRFRFVLALILMRKRLLKYEGMEARKEGGPEVWLMIPRGAEEAVKVVNPELSAEQIGEVSGELSGILAEEV